MRMSIGMVTSSARQVLGPASRPGSNLPGPLGAAQPTASHIVTYKIGNPYLILMRDYGLL